MPDLRASHSCQSPVHLDSRNRPEYGNPLEKYYCKSCHSPKKHSFLDAVASIVPCGMFELNKLCVCGGAPIWSEGLNKFGSGGR